MRKVFYFLVAAAVALPPLLAAFAPQASADSAAPPPSNILISEVKLGGDSFSQGPDQPKDPQEYITLFNPTNHAISLDGWLLEYAKSTFDKTYCNSTSWAAHTISGSASATKLSGILGPGGVSTPITRSLTDNAVGSLRLIDTSNSGSLVIDDLVGWGISAPCFEGAPSTTPSNGKSLKRLLDCQTNFPIDTSNNLSDFVANQPPSPNTLDYPYVTTCQESVVTVQQPTTSATCEGIIIDELLPNPAGSDAGNEYIELYNSSGSAVALTGCSLQTSASSKVYNFGNVSIAPGQYQAFYDSQTGLTLPNAAGGTVWLLSPSSELQSITYPPNLDDDISWAFIGVAWQATYAPTPNAANSLVASRPCPSGQERDDETNRCRTTTLTLTTASLSPCPIGEERSPITNRCRSATAVGSASLTACKEGQERNPTTNRCRAVTTSRATAKDCPAGQERNPATNRCRKVIATNLAKVQDIKAAAVTSDSAKWLIAGVAMLTAVGFGVYEWRQEIFLKFLEIKNRFVASG